MSSNSFMGYRRWWP